jgi:hypothetical protein
MKYAGPVLAITLACLATHAGAATLAAWNFNSNDGNVATGTLAPTAGSGTLSLIGGATGLFTSGSPNDPAVFPEDSAWSVGNYPAQGTASGTAGFRANVSTSGYRDITLAFDFRNQPSANRWFRVQASPDAGATWSDVATFDVTATDTWFSRSFAVSAAVPSIDDNALAALRVTAIFAPGTTAYAATSAGYNGAFGLEYDVLRVEGTLVPEPSAWVLALAGLAFTALAFRRRSA